MSTTPTFGEVFLAEVRSLTGSNPLDYAATQRVKAMERDEIIVLLRKNAGATYADIQRFKKSEDPRELARFLFEAQQRNAQAATLATTFSMLGFLMT